MEETTLCLELPELEQEETPFSPGLLLAVGPEAREGLAARFRAVGYHVMVAGCAEQAAELLTGIVPEAAVLEPAAFGGAMELAERLAGCDPRPECVVLARPEEQPLLFALYDDDLIYDHLWTPVADFGDVARRVGRAVERGEMRRLQSRLIGELREARFEMRGMQARVEALDRAACLGMMSASFLGALDAPLRDASAYAEYLGARLARGGEPLSEGQLARLSELLDDMGARLGASRVAARTAQEFAGAEAETPGRVELRALLAEALALVQPALEARGIRLWTRWGVALPEVEASPRRLQHAFLNLVRNAAEAAGSGGTITVTAEPTRDDAGEVVGARLTVSDNGPGLSADTLDEAFTAFYTTHEDSAHLGMGLTLARRIVQGWGGDLRLYSAPGRGAHASLTLRACHAEAQSPPGRKTEPLSRTVSEQQMPLAA